MKHSERSVLKRDCEATRYTTRACVVYVDQRAKDTRQSQHKSQPQCQSLNTLRLQQENNHPTNPTQPTQANPNILNQTQIKNANQENRAKQRKPNPNTPQKLKVSSSLSKLPTSLQDRASCSQILSPHMTLLRC